MITADEVGSGENVPPLPGGGGDDLKHLKGLSSYRQYESACLLLLPLKPGCRSCFLKEQVHSGTTKVAAGGKLSAPEPGWTGMGAVCGGRKESHAAGSPRARINKDKVATQEIRPKKEKQL